jgi:hypothetical protein
VTAQAEALAAGAPASARAHQGLMRLAPALGALLLVGLPFLVYWQNLSDFFMMDDFIWLKAAADHGFFDLMRRETSLSFRLDPFDYPTPYWRPLVDAYFWLTYRLFGFDPRAYHASAIALHAAVGVLVALIGWRVARSRLAGLAAGVLFVCLPTYNLAVTWVSEATDLLFTFFYLLALLFWFQHLRRDSGAGWPYLGAVLAFTLALCAKEPAIGFVPVAALAAVMETRPLSAERLKKPAAELAPFLLVAAFFYLRFFHREQSGLSSGGLYAIDERAIGNLWEYLKWISLPFGKATDLDMLRAGAAAVFIGSAGWLAIKGVRETTFLFLWTVIALLPLAFFNEGLDRRYTYLASVPFSIYLVVGTRRALSGLRLPARAIEAATIMLVVVAAPFFVQEVRASNERWHREAANYERLFHEAPLGCGPIRPGGAMYIVGSPTFDWAGLGTQVAMNFSYERVKVLRFDELALVTPEVRSFADCIVVYDGQRYVKQ